MGIFFLSLKTFSKEDIFELRQAGENEIYKLSGKKIQVFDNNTLNTINTLKKGIQDARAELDKIGNSKLQTELNNLEKKASELQQKLRIKGVTGEN